MTFKHICLAGAGLLASLFLGQPASAQPGSPPLEAAAPTHGDLLYGQVLIDELEYRFGDGKPVVGWDAQAWYGGDYNKAFLKSQGEYSSDDSFESAELQLLYSRLIGYYWDAQAGIRYDFEPDPSRAYGVIGLQGLAPGYFEVDLQGFVSEEGVASMRLEAEYDMLITQRLVLQPKFETNIAFGNDRDIGSASGFNDIDLGLRLRYEFIREVAPYIGVSWERRLGNTADLARDEGEDVDNLSFLVGVRLSF
jgi:copper resistance protein B